MYFVLQASHNQRLNHEDNKIAVENYIITYIEPLLSMKVDLMDYKFNLI